MGQAIEIKGDTGTLRIEVLRYEFLSAADFDDANWTQANVTLVIPGFRAQFDCFIQTTELSGLRDSLVTLYEAREGKASFEPLEPSIELEFTRNCRGAVQLEGRLEHPLGTGASLEFALDLDQSHLPTIVAQIGRAMSLFPIRGD